MRGYLPQRDPANPGLPGFVRFWGEGFRNSQVLAPTVRNLHINPNAAITFPRERIATSRAGGLTCLHESDRNGAELAEPTFLQESSPSVGLPTPPKSCYQKLSRGKVARYPPPVCLSLGLPPTELSCRKVCTGLARPAGSRRRRAHKTANFPAGKFFRVAAFNLRKGGTS
jgi:hypothetical protein